ncbi:hypothetical protein [Paraburkholderia fungorum]|uniref:Uncharacterized protein n=1 Tax=Paraburkholderia fungorum TaxID=134537 RepID=A0A3R7E8H2_9BURK|nr:hypothetical protein [Paraburkholderia fungorum]RKF47221.1 hypothetical protein BCY88_23225 [Paraburkholderia fungorum]
MTKESEIYASFIEHAELRPSGEIFLRGKDALQFVAVCQNAGMAVLGIEAARLDAHQVMPYIDAIADYSPRSAMQWETYQGRCNRLALDFLHATMDQKGEDTYFCFEVMDRAEHADCLKQITPAS